MYGITNKLERKSSSREDAGPLSPFAASVRHPPPWIGVYMVAQRGIQSREERLQACKSSRQGAVMASLSNMGRTR